MSNKLEVNFSRIFLLSISGTVAFVTSSGQAIGRDICTFLSSQSSSSSVSKLTSNEVAVVIQTLVYDGRLEIMRTVCLNILDMYIAFTHKL